MKAITFLIRLTAPMMAQRATPDEPNSATSYAYVPGSMVRGALIAQLPTVTRRVLVEDATWGSLLLGGRCTFLNAYAAHPTRQERLLPAPRSWREFADDANAVVYDFAVNPAPQLPARVSNPKPKRFDEDEYVGLGADGAGFYKPQREVVMHNFSPDRNKKAAGSSTVFRYEAIASGEVFAAAVLGDEADLMQLRTLIPEVAHMGGSRTGEYGAVRFEGVSEPAEFEEFQRAVQPDPDKVFVTALSPIILRDKLGCPQSHLDEALGGVKRLAEYGAMEIVGGFNRTWGLPIGQDWAIAAGSVFVYPRMAALETLLQTWMETGVGERRIEGFGRVGVDWQGVASLSHEKLARSEVITVAPLSQSETALAQRMARRQLEGRLERRLTQLVAEARIENAPRTSQMARVRVAARQAAAESRLDALSAHLASLRNANRNGDQDYKTGGKQLQQARVVMGKEPAKQSLMAWLEGQADMSTWLELWKPGPLPVVAGEAAVLDAALQSQFTARLVDGVLKKATKAVQANAKAKRGGGHA